MPQIIQTIDRIARIKQRDVLLLSFYDLALEKPLSEVPREDQFEARCQWQNYRREIWKKLPIRQKIIKWLDANKISWEPCGRFEPGWVIRGGYSGDIYLDVPYNKNLLLYQKIEEYLQYPDDSMRFENVIFFCLRLEDAMVNAEQDEPGFYENP